MLFEISDLIIFRMQSIKQKLKGFYEYSKNALGQNTPKWRKPMASIIGGQQVEQEKNHLKALAEYSLEPQMYCEMCDALLQELQKFSYDGKTLKKTERTLDLALFLVKHGSSQFSIDFDRNMDLFKKLSAINTRYFENKLSKDIKKLNHSLEVIRHRASYVIQLVKDRQLLTRERERAEKEMPLAAGQMVSYEEGTACNFKISSSQANSQLASYYDKSSNQFAHNQSQVAKQVPALRPKQSNEPFRQ